MAITTSGEVSTETFDLNFATDLSAWWAVSDSTFSITALEEKSKIKTSKHRASNNRQFKLASASTSEMQASTVEIFFNNNDATEHAMLTNHFQAAQLAGEEALLYFRVCPGGASGRRWYGASDDGQGYGQASITSFEHFGAMSASDSDTPLKAKFTLEYEAVFIEART